MFNENYGINSRKKFSYTCQITWENVYTGLYTDIVTSKLHTKDTSTMC